jgi:hypothetical protein
MTYIHHFCDPHQVFKNIIFIMMCLKLNDIYDAISQAKETRKFICSYVTLMIVKLSMYYIWKT